MSAGQMVRTAWNCVGAVLVVLFVLAPLRSVEPEKKGQKNALVPAGPFRALTALVKTQKPPTIDGTMEKDEWARAAVITGLLRGRVELYQLFGMEDVAADQSKFYLTYDDSNLYIAHHSPPPARIAGQDNLIASMLKSTITLHDGNVDEDDCLRLSIVNPYPGGREYKIYINGIGTTYEFWFGNLAWDPKLRHKSRLTPQGWTFEMAIPWAEITDLAKPRPGQALGMNFCRLWRNVITEEHIWHLEEKNAVPAGEVLFQGHEGVVVQLEDVGHLPRGQAAFHALLANHATAGKNLLVEVTTNSGEIRHTKEVALRPGQALPFNFKGRIVDFKTTQIAFRVSDRDSKQLYHVTTLPVRRKNQPDIYLRKYPGAEKIKFEANVDSLAQYPVADLAIDLVVLDARTGKAMAKKHAEKLPSFDVDLELSTAGWPVGRYDAAFTFLHKQQKVRQMSVPYERVPLPPWWNNTAGVEKKVPHPWTDMAVDRDAGVISCTGRRYRFGRRLFPEQIETAGRPLLRAPMQLMARAGDGTVLASDTAAVSEAAWHKTGPIRVEGQRVIGNDSFSLRNQFWAEYDGLVWCTLTIAPKPGKKITLDGLTLALPLTPEFTDVINTYDYSLRDTGKLKPAGYESQAKPLWLGNGDGGIQWLTETIGPFFVKDERKVLRVNNGPEGATLTVVMIDTPTVFEAEHQIAFGFIATPVRPKTWRTKNDSKHEAPGPWYPEDHRFVPAVPWYYGKNGYLYVTGNAINSKSPGFADFGNEWLRDPHLRPKDNELVAITQASRSFRDWFVWRHWEYQQKNGIGALYFDIAHEVASTNPWAGAGYKRRDGRIVSTAPILGSRDVCKRLYNILIEKTPQAWIGQHNSGMYNMAFCQFGTDFWDGENFNSLINDKQRTYRGVLDPAMFRAEYMGHNFGCPTYFLGQARLDISAELGGAAVIDHIHGLMLLHDTHVTGWHAKERAWEQACSRTFRAMGVHKLYQPDHYRFIPYWRQKFVKLPSNDTYASFYIRGGEGKPVEKVVAIIYNDSPFEGPMKLAIDWKALGLDSWQGLKVENAVHTTGFRVETVKDKKGTSLKPVFFAVNTEYARIENGQLAFPMSPWNYRMIVIAKETKKDKD